MGKPKVYIDNSALQRPFDDRSQPRIELEARAMLSVFRMIRGHHVELTSSTIVELENSKCPFPYRKHFVTLTLGLASSSQRVSEPIRLRGRELEAQGIKEFDALHLACAEAAGVTYFLSCDDQVLKRYTGILKVLSPAIFVLRFEDRAGD
jgi:hypothetical protein